MSNAERAASTNGIWLCRTCAKLVDSDEIEFPADLLIFWKQSHEASVLNAGKAPSSTQSATPTEIEAALTFVVGPLFAWVNSCLMAAAGLDRNQLWPLRLHHHQHAKRLPSITRGQEFGPMTFSYSVDPDPLLPVSPLSLLFRRTAEDVFPRALSAWPSVRDGLHSLQQCYSQHLVEAASSARTALHAHSGLLEKEAQDCALPLAYTLLCDAWAAEQGRPATAFANRDSQIECVVGERPIVVYEGPERPGVERAINALLSEYFRRGVPEDVVKARQSLTSRMQELIRRLEYPRHLSVDLDR